VSGVGIQISAFRKTLIGIFAVVALMALQKIPNAGISPMSFLRSISLNTGRSSKKISGYLPIRQAQYFYFWYHPRQPQYKRDFKTTHTALRKKQAVPFQWLPFFMKYIPRPLAAVVKGC